MLKADQFGHYGSLLSFPFYLEIEKTNQGSFKYEYSVFTFEPFHNIHSSIRNLLVGYILVYGWVYNIVKLHKEVIPKVGSFQDGI